MTGSTEDAQHLLALIDWTNRYMAERGRSIHSVTLSKSYQLLIVEHIKPSQNIEVIHGHLHKVYGIEVTTSPVGGHIQFRYHV